MDRVREVWAAEECLGEGYLIRPPNYNRVVFYNWR